VSSTASWYLLGKVTVSAWVGIPQEFYLVFLSYKLYNTNLYNTICTVQIVYKLYSTVFVRIHTDEFIQLFVVFVRIHTIFYTNCIVRIHTKRDLYYFSKSAQMSREGEAQATSAQRKPRGRSPSCERVARAPSAQREPRGRNPSHECSGQAARARPKHTSCHNQAAPGCPDH
jgi:hypothetical protein